MILIGSAILFVFGMLLLLREAIVISYSLIKLAVLLVALCGCALLLAAAGCGWLGVKLISYFLPEPIEPEPMIPLNIRCRRPN